MQGRVRAWHETLPERLKNWGVLSQVFRHHISLDDDVFWACGVLTQPTIEYSGQLFEVKYTD